MVVKAIKQAACSSSVGPDSIPIVFWQNLNSSLFDVLARLFTDMINQNFIPASWKTGIVVPVFKGKVSKLEIANYRPITITDTISMGCERILVSEISDKYSKLISDNQYGFKAKHNTF